MKAVTLERITMHLWGLKIDMSITFSHLCIRWMQQMPARWAEFTSPHPHWRAWWWNWWWIARSMSLIETCIPACIVSKLADGRVLHCWEYHGWVSPKKMGTPHNSPGGLSSFYLLARDEVSCSPGAHYSLVGSDSPQQGSFKPSRQSSQPVRLIWEQQTSSPHPPPFSCDEFSLTCW